MAFEKPVRQALFSFKTAQIWCQIVEKSFLYLMHMDTIRTRSQNLEKTWKNHKNAPFWKTTFYNIFKGAFRPWDRLSQIMVLLYLKDASSSPLHEYHKKNLEKAIIFAKNTKNRAWRCLKCGYLAEIYRKVPSECIRAFDGSPNFGLSLS